MAAASGRGYRGSETIFQIDMELSRQEAQIVSAAEILPGNIAFSCQEKSCHNIAMLISMAANSLLDIKGMRASIVIGLDIDHKVRVSARSLGDINVQRMMEKLGGGGHLTMAGAQLDLSVEEAAVRVKAVAAEFVEEERQRLRAKQNAEKRVRQSACRFRPRKQE